MDPQAQSTQKAGPTLVRGATPATSVQAELVNDIPVQSPAGGARPNSLPPTVPATKFPQPTVIQAGQKGNDQEHNRPKDANTPVKKAQLKQSPHDSPPILATIIACLVALALSVGVVLVFKQ